MSVPRRYGLLRAIAVILKLLAWLLLLAGLVGVLILLVVGTRLSPQVPEILRTLTTAGVFVTPVLAIIGFVQLFAWGSILSLLIDIEHNTRALAGQSDG